MSMSLPKQTDSQSLGKIGETTVKLIFQKYKWTADIIDSDFGEDIECNIFINNERTNYYFRCQVKSSSIDSDYVRQLKNGDFSVSIKSNTIRAWLTSYFPVILVIFDEDSDLCYWCNPQKEILENTSKLENIKPTIHISKSNVLNLKSKEAISNEIKDFYKQLLRTSESFIMCEIIAVAMPGYKIIPIKDVLININHDHEFDINIASFNWESLPSWMTILNSIEPLNSFTGIEFKTNFIDIEIFQNEIKKELAKFNFQLKEYEWITFICSPIKISSKKSNWSNEVTYWTSYIKIDDQILSEYDYNFDIPDHFLRQATRRSRSWDYFHFVNPDNDLAVQFFSVYEETYTMKKIKKIHHDSIRGQLILWTCYHDEMQEISEILSEYNLMVQIVDEKKENMLIAISSPFFDPFLGLSIIPGNWDQFENSSVKDLLIKNDLLLKLPGNEYSGKVPDYLEVALSKYNHAENNSILCTELDYIHGFPTDLNKRTIRISRFKMLNRDEVHEIESSIKKINKEKNIGIELNLITDEMWSTPIYECAMNITPDLRDSSSDFINKNEMKIMELLNYIFPTDLNSNKQLKNTYDILYIAGEIGFEKKYEKIQ